MARAHAEDTGRPPFALTDERERERHAPESDVRHHHAEMLRRWMSRDFSSGISAEQRMWWARAMASLAEGAAACTVPSSSESPNRQIPKRQPPSHASCRSNGRLGLVARGRRQMKVLIAYDRFQARRSEGMWYVGSGRHSRTD